MLGFLNSALTIGGQLGGQYLQFEAQQNLLERQAALQAQASYASSQQTNQLITFGVIALVGVAVFKMVAK